jgi:hypothetical protein
MKLQLFYASRKSHHQGASGSTSKRVTFQRGSHPEAWLYLLHGAKRWGLLPPGAEDKLEFDLSLGPAEWWTSDGRVWHLGSKNSEWQQGYCVHFRGMTINDSAK